MRPIILLLFWFILFLFQTPSSYSQTVAQTISLKEALRLAKERNLELKAQERFVQASQLEKESAKGAYFPVFRFEETYAKTDFPANVFFYKLNQGKMEAKDFEVKRLNSPSSYENFETKFVLELPIWLGGRIQALNKLSELRLLSTESLKLRKTDEILFETYLAYLWIFLNKQAVKVAETSIAEAEEHLRVAQERFRAGLALEADVYRAEVYLAKAKESKDVAVNNLNLAKRRLEVLVNTKLSPFDIEELQACPKIEEEKYQQIALKKRPDLKALDYEIKALDEQRKVVLSDNLPQISGFAEYSMNGRNYPFESQGDGYTAGIKFVWRFDTGRTVLKKASATVEQKSALLERYKYLQDNIALEVESAISDYRNALTKLRSAEERVKHAKEVVRVMQTRYSAGLVRMVDLLDAQTQLDLARFERIEAIKACHEAFAKLLFASSSFEELL